ncbi:MAG TPA: class I SAM-dependent methyltransferase [Alcaligenes faecalis]|nr:class I SAM-dependent methyltransferase [Alcaligenes faecalis]
MIGEDLNQYAQSYEGSSIYDLDNGVMLNWYSKRIIRLLNPALSVLELGIGHGYTTYNFARYFADYVVLEGSGHVIDQYQRNYPDSTAQFINGRFEDFTADRQFDVIVMGFVLEHVDDPVGLLARYRAYLKPGGRVFVAVPNAHAMNRRLGHLAGLLEDMQALSDYDFALGHKRYYSRETLALDIDQAGYQLHSLEGIYLKPFTTRQIQSLDLDDNVFKALCELGVAYPELSCAMLAELTPNNQ